MSKVCQMHVKCDSNLCQMEFGKEWNCTRIPYMAFHYSTDDFPEIRHIFTQRQSIN